MTLSTQLLDTILKVNDYFSKLSDLNMVDFLSRLFFYYPSIDRSIYTCFVDREDTLPNQVFALALSNK